MAIETTDGTSGTAKPEPVTSAAIETTPTSSDTGGRTAEDRISGYSAENKRLKAMLEKEKAEREALVEQHKSDDQKRIDALVEERTAPHRAENQQLRTFFHTRLDAMNAALPEEYRREIKPDASLEVLQEQYNSIELLSRGLSEKKIQPSVDSSASPPAVETKPIITMQQFRDWQAMASVNPAGYREIKADMESAWREGRVK